MNKYRVLPWGPSAPLATLFYSRKIRKRLLSQMRPVTTHVVAIHWRYIYDMATFFWGVVLPHLWPKWSSLYAQVHIRSQSNDCPLLGRSYQQRRKRHYPNQCIHKTTDAHLYLHYTSFHAKHQKKSIPYSQAIRMKRICSTPDLFQEACKNLKINPRKWGYPTALIDSAIGKAASKDRIDLLHSTNTPTTDPHPAIPFIVTYNPRTPPIKRILENNRKILTYSQDLQSIASRQFLLVQRRCLNLKQLLVHTNLNPAPASKGSSPCNKPCIICPFMKNSTDVTSHVTNKHYRLKGYYNWQTKSAVYLISCSKCGLQYVGQTGNTINERICGHLTDIRAGNDFKPVSRHFTSNNHTVNDVNVTAIITTSQTTNIRLRTEEVWIALLQTR